MDDRKGSHRVSGLALAGCRGNAKMVTDWVLIQPLIPIAVGRRSIAFPWRSVKAGVDRAFNLCPNPGKRLILGQPAGVHDDQLRVDLPPVPNGHGPFLLSLLFLFLPIVLPPVMTILSQPATSSTEKFEQAPFSCSSTKT